MVKKAKHISLYPLLISYAVYNKIPLKQVYNHENPIPQNESKHIYCAYYLSLIVIRGFTYSDKAD